MSKTSTTKGFAVLSAASFLVKILAIVYLPFQTAILGDVGNGIVAKGYAIWTFLFSLSNAGLPNAISKLVAEQVAKKNYKAADKILKFSYWVLLAMGIIIGLIMSLGAKQLAILNDQPDAYLMLMMFAPGLIFTSISCALRGYFQGRQNMVPVAISQIIEQVLNTVFTVLFEYLLLKYGRQFSEEQGLVWGAAGSSLGTVVAAIGAVTFLVYVFYGVVSKSRKREIEHTDSSLEVPTNNEVFKKILHYSLPAILNTVAICAAGLIDNRLTARLRYSGMSKADSDALFGIYGTQYTRIIILTVIFVNALVTTMIPAISEAFALNDHKLVKHRLNRSYRTIYLVTIPSIVGITVLAKPMLYLIFPTRPVGEDLIIFGAWTMIFSVIQSVQTGALLAAGRPTAPSINLIIGMTVKLGLNYVLVAIPWLNVKGAILGTAIGYIVAIMLNQTQIKQCYPFKTYHLRMMIKPLFSSIIMGVSCYASYFVIDLILKLITKKTIISSDIAVLFAVAVGIGVYFVVMILTNAVKRSDIMSLPMGSKIYRVLTKFEPLRKRLA